MPKHKPTHQPSSEAVPFLWGDVRCLLNSWSLRPVPIARSKGKMRTDDSQQVRKAVEVLVQAQSLRPGPRYAVPLKWVHEELQRRFRKQGLSSLQARERSQHCLVNALNDDDSGLELVPCRRLALAS